MPLFDFGFATSWLSSMLSRDSRVSRSGMLPPVDRGPETPASLPAGTEAAGYVIDERIGVGGFGEVFRAHHPVIGRKVAIKVLHARYSNDPSAVARFVDEARAVNRISHPNIVEIFDFGSIVGRELYVMELIEGTLLRDLLRERGHLPLTEALPILRGIAEAVDATHRASIAHRDLKPDNVFVLADGRIKLIDFGLAKLTREQEPVTQSGSIFGTPLYMSPEQCRGRAIDTRTDLYSFGALAYHVLTGEPPFGGDPIELALHHVNDRPDPPSKRCAGLTRNIDRVVLALLAKDPAERPASLGAAVDALAGSARLRVRSKRLRYAAIGVVAAGGAALGVANLPAGSPHEPKPDCVPAAERIAEIWNTSSRASIDAHFTSKRDDVRQAWKRTSDSLDAVVGRWSTQWDQACHAADRTTDAMLYGERIACLDTALLGLQGWLGDLATTDIVTFAETSTGEVDLGTGGRALADCENPAALRAQVPPPPLAARPRIAALQLDVTHALARGWEAFTARDVPAADRALGELDKLSREIETLDGASAADAIRGRLELEVEVARDKDVRRLAAARVSAIDAIRRIEASRDDVALAHAYLILASLEMGSLHRPEAVRATDAVDRAAQAVTRAGNPVYATLALAESRGQLGLALGRFDDAAGGFRDAIRIATLAGADPTRDEIGLIIALARGERPTEAIATAIHGQQRTVDRFGANHAQTGWAHNSLSSAYELAGDLESAVRERRLAAETYASSTTSPPQRKTWGRAYVVELELRAGKGREPDTIALLRDLAKLGTTPAGHNPDGIATARRAGLFDAFRFGAERTDITGEDERLDHLATLAFARGDSAAMARFATASAARCAKPGACTAWIRFSRWLAVLADARTHPSTVDARLAALESEYAIPSATAYSGIVLASLGRWSDARPKLETARDATIWEYQQDLAELDAWLGLARRMAGDLPGARAAFEESLRVLSIERNGIEGFSYTTPVAQIALADLLWVRDSKDPHADADRTRARRLAERARDGFTKLGPFETTHRDEAIKWLDDRYFRRP